MEEQILSLVVNARCRRTQDEFVFSEKKMVGQFMFLFNHLLASSQDSFRRKVEETLPEKKYIHGGWLNKNGMTVMVTVDQVEGYNKAIDDVLAKLKTLNK